MQLNRWRFSSCRCFKKRQLLISEPIAQGSSLSCFWDGLITFLFSFFVLLIFAFQAGCTNEPRVYFPLSQGHIWEYQETLNIKNDIFERRKLVRSEAPVIHQDEEIYLQQHQGGKRSLLVNRPDGIYRLKKEQLEQQILLLPLPLKHAMETELTWQLSSRLGVLESRTFALEDRILTNPPTVELKFQVVDDEQTVQVPAGIFKHCFMIRAEGKLQVFTDRGNNSADVTVISHDWYAPGVGLIKTVREELSDSVFLKPGKYTLELVHFE